MIAVHLLKAIDLSGECFGLPWTIRNVFQVAFILTSKRDVGFPYEKLCDTLITP